MTDPRPETAGPSREQVCSELAMIEAAELISLASACVADAPDIVVTRPPTIGSIVAQVREPVAEQRFILADVLACQAEVMMRGHQGWAMRMGSDRLATLAAAVCAAEFESAGPHQTEIVELCVAGQRRRTETRAAEWQRLAPSVVEFEEIP
jgi:alpha-D-ribose 1-methylphosphonate 5-triphosphate synthase subunit PhnG